MSNLERIRLRRGQKSVENTRLKALLKKVLPHCRLIQAAGHSLPADFNRQLVLVACVSHRLDHETETKSGAAESSQSLTRDVMTNN